MEKKQQSCSVCLEQVTDIGERSIAKLKCGHHFHLDCIGSAFNAKGSMQCPNCRHVEDGRWLYANGGRPQDDWIDDFPTYDDEYEVYGIADVFHSHLWCPYQQPAYPQFSVTLEEMDPPNGPYPDVIVNVLYGEQAPLQAPTSAPYCPYLSGRQARRFDDHVLETGGGGGSTMVGGGSTTRGLGPHQAYPSSQVGMVNDVGLASIPNDRFRWPVRNDAHHSAYIGYVSSRVPLRTILPGLTQGLPSRGGHRNSEGVGLWGEPCPQGLGYGVGVGSSQYQNPSPNPHSQGTAPTFNPPRYNNSTARRPRQRYAAASSNSRAAEHHLRAAPPVAPPAAAVRGAPPPPPPSWGSLDQPPAVMFMAAPPSDPRYSGAWGGAAGYEVEWRPWFQSSSSSGGASSGVDSSSGASAGSYGHHQYHHHHHHHHHGGEQARMVGDYQVVAPEVPPEYVTSRMVPSEYLVVEPPHPEALPANLRHFMPHPR